jgi:hypothetical protein
MNIQELKLLADTKPNVVSIILKSNYTDVFNEIDSKYTHTDKFTEKLYLHINQMEIPICKNDECTEMCNFITLKKGYSLYCSNKCSSIDTRDKRIDSIKKTMNQRYGVNSPFELDSVKSKLSEHHKNGVYNYDSISKKTKKTLLEKYGDENFNNSDKSKHTKLEKYGDENFNNRDKFKQTLITKYGEAIHPNTKVSVEIRSNNGELGFKSDKFKQWLSENNISNTSQLPTVKLKKIKKQIDNSYEAVVQRINEYVVPNFTKSEFNGVGYYDVKYEFNCKKCGNIFDDYLYGGHIPRCTQCFPLSDNSSIGQTELYNFLKEILPNETIILNDRKVLSGKELDIYIPNKSIAIEFNGIYYHSELTGGKDKTYHINKTNECNSKKIRLIHIKDIDWFNNQSIIKNRMINLLTTVTEKIYARKCKIVELTKSEKSKILSKYHLQGNDKSQIHIGLKYEDEIVSVMTFGSLRNIMGSSPIKDTYELYRYTSNGVVIGGASKLFKYFIKTYKPYKVITYSKLDWGYSSFYEQIGFKFSHKTPPNYWYIHRGKLIHRSNFQKHKLKDKLEVFNPSLSEWENMQLNGYDRIWDCGNLKYEWVKK